MITKIERAQFTSAEQAKSIRPITYIDRERKIELRYDTLAELIMYYDRVAKRYKDDGKIDEYQRYGVTTQEDYDNYLFCINHDINPRIAQFVLCEERCPIENKYFKSIGYEDDSEIHAKLIEKDGEIYCTVETPIETIETPFSQEFYDGYRNEYSDSDLEREGNIFDYDNCLYQPDYYAIYLLTIVNDNGVRKIVQVPFEDAHKYSIGETVLYENNNEKHQGVIERYWEACEDYFPYVRSFDGKILDVVKTK